MAIATSAVDMHLRSSQAMGLLAQTPFSVTCWIKAVWNPGSRRSFVGICGPSIGTGDVPLATPFTAMQIGTSGGNNELTCWTWGGGTLVGTGTGVMASFNNIWCQIAYTYNGTTHRVYRNGVELANATTTQLAGYLNQVYINGYPGGVLSEVAAYEIDQYAVYRRELSAAEVLTIYNAGGARHGISYDLVCRYEYDELASGANVVSVPDFSGNGHTLTPTGAGANFTYTYNNVYPNSNIRMVQ